MQAAVCSAVNGGLVVEDLVLGDPGPDEVLVRIDAAGVCHSDHHYLTGDLVCPLPVVPGHEGAGVVVEVGERVGAVRPGDSVCLMWRPRCGRCRFCLDGRPGLCQPARSTPRPAGSRTARRGCAARTGSRCTT